MALTPLPPPAILVKCGGHILSNAYMHAYRPSPTTCIGVLVAIVHSPAHESGTLDTVEIAGLIPNDQRLFTPSAQVTPMTCKKAVFACLDTDVTFTPIYWYISPRLELQLWRDVGWASWHGQSRQRKRRQMESADCPHVHRYLKPTVNPSLPY